VDTVEFDRCHGGNNLGTLMREIRSAGYHTAVPVTRVGHTAQHVDVAASQAARRVGMALRLDAASVNWNSVDITLAKCGVSAGETDLIVDLGELTTREAAKAILVVGEALFTAAAAHAEWRTITMLSGAITEVAAVDSFVTIPRYDWMTWRILQARLRAKGIRAPAFGDYGTLYPKYEIPEFANAPMPYVRYTAWRMWLVRRSRAVGGRQAGYVRICEALVATPQFARCTRTFSEGDETIDDVARGTGTKFGQAVTWVRVMLSHHMFFATGQISALP
jgi:hypothetical protein